METRMVEPKDVVNTCYYFNGYRLCPITRELSLDGEWIGVESRVFDLLFYLIENRHRAVGKQELEEKLWGGNPLSETVLAHSIMKARQAVGDTGKRQHSIRTIRAFGYRFVAKDRVEALTNDLATADEIKPKTVNSKSDRPSRWAWITPTRSRRAIFNGVALAILMLVGAWEYSNYASDTDNPPENLQIITLELPPVRAISPELGSMGMRLTILLDRRLSEPPWLKVTANPESWNSSESTADFVLLTELRLTESGYEMLCTLRSSNGLSTTWKDLGKNPFQQADAVVARVRLITRDAARSKSEKVKEV